MTLLSYFMQQATIKFYNEEQGNFCKKQLLQQVTSKFRNEQRVIFCNEQLLQRVTIEFCNEQRVILQWVMSNEWIWTSNEQWVKSYASNKIFKIFSKCILVRNRKFINLIFESRKSFPSVIFTKFWKLRRIFFSWNFINLTFLMH